VNPGGGSGWDEPPLDIQIPDDARELARDVLAYHRELRARRRRSRLRKLTRPFGGQGTVMPLLASILAVCLVAGAMLSVATFSPASGPATPTHSPTATASGSLRSNPQTTAPASASAARTSAAGASAASPSGSPSGSGTVRPSGSANSSARSSPSASQVRPTTPGGP